MKEIMKLIPLLALVVLAGCSQSTTKSVDVAADIRTSLDQAGFKDVSSTQDRDKGVVTLGGNVADDSSKRQAESIAMAHAGGQVVSNQIAVIPLGGESDAKAVNSDLDSGIEKKLDAVLIQNNM